jgi:HlyD family secretion protein
MKTRSWIILLLLVVAAGAVALARLGAARRRADALPPGIVAASGRVEAREFRVSAGVGGRVLRLLVAEGDAVREGQTVAELDRRTSDAAASGAQALVASAEEQAAAAEEAILALQAQLDLAEIEAIRYRRLYDHDAAPRQAVDRADAAVAQLRRQIHAAHASGRAGLRQVDAARAQARAASVPADETTVLAPASGFVEDEIVRAGEMVAPGMPLLLIARSDPVTVKVYLPIADAQRLRPGTEARAWVEGIRDRWFAGTVERIGTQAEFTPKDVHMPDDRTTLVFAVELRFANPDGTLKDGFPADVYIRWDPRSPWPARRPWQ